MQETASDAADARFDGAGAVPTEHREDSSSARHDDAAARRSHALKAVRWWCVHGDGSRETITDRESMRSLTGVPLRDLRGLEPAFHFPASIMVREHALVLNLEHVKAIVTADVVLVQQVDDPAVLPFVAHLSAQLFAMTRVDPAAAADDGALVVASLAAGEKRPAAAADGRGQNACAKRTVAAGGMKLRSAYRHAPLARPVAPAGLGALRAPLPHFKSDTLPFELRALELCLAEVVDMLCGRVDLLVDAVVPVFDQLASGVTKALLEAARQQKTAVVRLLATVSAVRGAIEALFNGAELLSLCLTLKRSANTTGRHVSAAGLKLSLDALDEREAVAHAENLLEAYFERMDGAKLKLDELREYVENTESYVTIDLDSHRNQLMQLELLLSIGTLCLTAYGVIGSIFGMNIQFWRDDYADLSESGLPGPETFRRIVAWASAGCSAAFLLMIAYCLSLIHI